MICQGCGTENGAGRELGGDCAGSPEAGCPVCGTPAAVEGEGAGVTARVGIPSGSAGRQALDARATPVAGWRPRWQLP